MVLISINSASLRGCDSVATAAYVFDLVLHDGRGELAAACDLLKMKI